MMATTVRKAVSSAFVVFCVMSVSSRWCRSR